MFSIKHTEDTLRTTRARFSNFCWNKYLTKNMFILLNQYTKMLCMTKMAIGKKIEEFFNTKTFIDLMRLPNAYSVLQFNLDSERRATH